LYPDVRFEVGSGIGEQLVAAEQLLRRYDNARQGAEPHGWAIVQAAIDWVRMDVGRPIQRSELAALYPLYLQIVRPTAEPKNDLIEPLSWACTPVGFREALLRPVLDGPETSYIPFDYLVGVADGQNQREAQPIPDHAWNKLTQHVTPTECNRAGISAGFRHLHSAARTLFASVVETDDADVAPWAMFNLGTLLHEQEMSMAPESPTSRPSTPVITMRRRWR
jgi:hypothetical protein